MQFRVGTGKLGAMITFSECRNPAAEPGPRSQHNGYTDGQSRQPVPAANPCGHYWQPVSSDGTRAGTAVYALARVRGTGVTMSDKG